MISSTRHFLYGMALMALGGCGQEAGSPNSKEGDQPGSQQLIALDNKDYQMCIARAGAVATLDTGANYKTACEAVSAPNSLCATELANIARLHENVTSAAIIAARDACEGPRIVGPAYTPPKIAPDLMDGESDADWWASADGDALRHENTKRLRDRTAFTRANLDAINRCFHNGDWDACISVQRAAEKALEEVEAYGYLCVSLTGSIVDRQAAHNQPDAIAMTPNNIGKPIADMFDIQPKSIGGVAYGCNMELRKSGLPALKKMEN